MKKTMILTATALLGVSAANADVVVIVSAKNSASTMTTEEVKTVIAEAETAGVLVADERRMISGVLRLGDRPVRGIMTPRSDVDWIDLEADQVEIYEILKTTAHSRLPAGQGIDDIVVASSNGGPLVWYEAPGWQRHVIAPAGGWSCDAAVAAISQL